MNAIIQKAERLLDLKSEKDTLKERLSNINAEIDALSDEMVTAMEDEGMETFAAHNTTFYIKQVLHASLPAENRETFIKRLRARKLGHIVRPVVNPQTLTSFVKEQAEACGGIDELPKWISDLVKTYNKAEIATRKRK